MSGGAILLLVGLVISLVGGIWLLIEAFKTSIWWGLGYIFIPFVSLIFVILHWDVAKRPFLISLLGGVLLVVGVLITGSGIHPATSPTPAPTGILSLL